MTRIIASVGTFRLFRFLIIVPLGSAQCFSFKTVDQVVHLELLINVLSIWWWLQLITKAMVGSRTWLGGLFNRIGNYRRDDRFIELSPLQQQRLQRLQERIKVPFDESRPDHLEALLALWHLAFPNVVLTGTISEQWKDMGWQGPNPSTDFRGCGFVSLENLLFYARTYPKSFRRLLMKEGGKRATWEYPFAVAGINITFMLSQMLNLYAGFEFSADKPKCLPGLNFIRLLAEDEHAFDFEMMDSLWLAMGASYMEFNEVLQVTKTQLERELSSEDFRRVRELPSYSLLFM